jgi:hypothetical protein
MLSTHGRFRLWRIGKKETRDSVDDLYEVASISRSSLK